MRRSVLNYPRWLTDDKTYPINTPAEEYNATVIICYVYKEGCGRVFSHCTSNEAHKTPRQTDTGARNSGCCSFCQSRHRHLTHGQRPICLILLLRRCDSCHHPAYSGLAECCKTGAVVTACRQPFESPPAECPHSVYHDCTRNGPTSEQNTRNCIEEVLQTVLRRADLFILCQDKITQIKHKCICEKLGLELETIKPNYAATKKTGAHAAIYYNALENFEPPRYISQDELEMVNNGMMKLGVHFNPKRLMACVVTSAEVNIMLISWHGPQNTISDENKKLCFRDLLQFSRRLQRLKRCDFVVLGGDFNLVVSKSKPLIKDLNAVILNIQSQDNLDYIVFWPSSEVCPPEKKDIVKLLSGPSDITPSGFERKPFNHPIVMNCLKISTERMVRIPPRHDRTDRPHIQTLVEKLQHTYEQAQGLLVEIQTCLEKLESELNDDIAVLMQTVDVMCNIPAEFEDAKSAIDKMHDDFMSDLNVFKKNR
ncbi:hypothetical protein BaRGS_00028253 [Batillaria attramentaria]|uniref:Endonuclease/exonuclease/phosphatase domain-containing protein n=1 Tax=Batillaria attramentaria TaxID=370345 RepID=A0ABD0K0A1_9CAEN